MGHSAIRLPFFIYIGKMEEKAVKVALGQFVNQVLEGTLIKSRYKTHHLSVVFQNNRSLKKLWMEGAKMDLKEVLETLKAEGTLIGVERIL